MGFLTVSRKRCGYHFEKYPSSIGALFSFLRLYDGAFILYLGIFLWLPLWYLEAVYFPYPRPIDLTYSSSLCSMIYGSACLLSVFPYINFLAKSVMGGWEQFFETAEDTADATLHAISEIGCGGSGNGRVVEWNTVCSGCEDARKCGGKSQRSLLFIHACFVPKKV